MNSDVTEYIYLRTLVLLNALLETFSCVYSDIMFTIILYFQIKAGGGGVGKFFEN